MTGAAIRSTLPPLASGEASRGGPTRQQMVQPASATSGEYCRRNLFDKCQVLTPAADRHTLIAFPPC